MPSPRALVATLLLSWALGLTGCGGPERDPPSPWVHPWGCRPKQYVTLWEPEATHGRWDPFTEQRLVVNLLPDGNVMFWGQTYPLATGTAAERLQSLTALDAAVEERCEDPAWRGPLGACKLPLTVHADRHVRWSMLRDVLEVVIGPGARDRRLHWTVSVATVEGWVRQEADVTALGPQTRAEDASTLVVHLAGHKTALDAAEIQIELGDRTWTTTEAEPTWPDASPPPAAWDEIRAYLASVAPAHRGVRLTTTETDHAIRWVHVARMLDVILGSGLREVALPDLGVRLSLLDPEDLTVDPYACEDDPVVTPLTVVLSGAALVLVFGLAFVPLRGLRRKRPRRPRST